MACCGKAQYDEAAAAFRAYADANPDDDDLAPQAIYWVGDIAYMQQDYRRRARSLRRRDQEISQVSRAPPTAMLKLGQSLHGDGPETRKAAPRLALIKSKYPDASPQDPHRRLQPHRKAGLQQIELEDRFRARRWRRTQGAWPAPCGVGRRRFPRADASAGALGRAPASVLRPSCSPSIMACARHRQRDARKVARWAKDAGLKAHVLVWRGKKPKADIEAGAREARYRLMGAWWRRSMARRALSSVTPRTIRPRRSCCGWRAAAGWTAWPRCARCAPFPAPGFRQLASWRGRCWASRRRPLRDYLAAPGQDWLEDPDEWRCRAFARVQIRAAWRRAGRGRVCRPPASPRRRASGAGARSAGSHRPRRSWRGPARAGEAGVLLDPSALAAAPREIGLRALAELLMTVSGAGLPAAIRAPGAAVRRDWRRRALGGGATLHGCHIRPAPQGLRRLTTSWSRRKVPRKTGEFRRAARLSLIAGSRLRETPKSLNVLMAGNALETSYLIGAGQVCPRPTGAALA